MSCSLPEGPCVGVSNPNFKRNQNFTLPVSRLWPAVQQCDLDTASQTTSVLVIQQIENICFLSSGHAMPGPLVCTQRPSGQPPRPSRNACGVVPVCLRKKRVKCEGSEKARS